MKNIRNKLSSQKGETLSEVMVAALIGGMALLLLVTMIMSATRMVERSSKKMTVFYDQVSALESGTADGNSKLESKDDTVQIEYGVSGKVSIEVTTTTATPAAEETNSGLTAYKKK